MGWASHIIPKLQAGETVSFRPKGQSMTPKIKSGELCTVEPLGTHVVAKGDIVLCKVNGRQFLHLVTAVKPNQVQISNNHGHVNGWCNLNAVYGLLVDVQP